MGSVSMSSFSASLCGVIFPSVATAAPNFFAYQPPPKTVVRRGVTTVGPANGICAGVDDDVSTVASKSRVYIAQCNGTFSTTRTGATSYDTNWGYLSMQMDATALIRGADGAYITSPSSCATVNDAASCVDGNNILSFNAAGGAATAYQNTDAAATSGTATYAYASTGAYFGKAGLPGTENGFYAGTASYLVTSGTVSTNTNSFDIAGTQKSACISNIAFGVCGTAREFTIGTYKFSLFGHTVQNDAGAIANALSNTAGGAFDYVGFRQRITLGGSPAGATLLFQVTTTAGATVNLDNIAGEDASGFRLCVNTDCLDYTFPTAYNYGIIVGGQAITTGATTSNLKIKISKPATTTCTQCAYVDYLFPVAGLDGADKWFVYDPNVAVGSTATPAPTPSASRAGNTSPWVLGNSLVCIASLMAWWW